MYVCGCRTWYLICTGDDQRYKCTVTVTCDYVPSVVIKLDFKLLTILLLLVQECSYRVAMEFFFYPTAPQISAMVTANRNTPLMVNGDNTLTCDVSGDDNLSSTITYQWTRSDATSQTLVGTNSRTLSLSSVGLSDAGNYACHATVSSGLLINDITMSSGNQTVIVQGELVIAHTQQL